jgi:uncharacterized membrane protein
MKKIFFGFVFAAMVLAVVPKAQTQDFSQIGREMELAAADLRAGKITVQEFQRQVQEIQERARGLPVPAEVQALSQTDVQAIEKLTADFHRGKISLQEFQRLVNEIYQRAQGR